MGKVVKVCCWWVVGFERTTQKPMVMPTTPFVNKLEGKYRQPISGKCYRVPLGIRYMHDLETNRLSLRRSYVSADILKSDFRYFICCAIRNRNREIRNR